MASTVWTKVWGDIVVNTGGYPVVNTYADLPDPLSNNDKIYVVKTATGIFPFNRKPAGLYHSNGVSWDYMSVYPDIVKDGNFGIQNSIDPTKVMKFDASGITTGQTRTYILPDANGTLALVGASDLYNNALPSAITVGGIPAGSTFTDRTMQNMFDDLLYPELFPTLVNSSSVFSLIQSGLHEIGEVITTLNFSSTFNRGSISPAYTTSGFRSGLPNTYKYVGTGLTNFSSTSLTDAKTVSSYTVLSGAQSWTHQVAYDAGEQPLSSKGNNYSTPLVAGDTSVKTVTITGVYPYFYNSSSLTTFTKQSLVASNSVLTTNMLAEDGTNKQAIEIPSTWNAISKLEQYNTLSGQWDVILISSFTSTDVTETIQGNVIGYKRYTHNGTTTGARQLRWTF